MTGRELMGRCVTGVLLFILAGPALAAPPEPVSDDVLTTIVNNAPTCPADIDSMDMKLRLIDYVDFTDPNDPHDMMDQGTSKVVTTPGGTYRITAPHHHAFFSYAFKTAGRDKPVLLVIEYPDDADRITSFMTHDSVRPWMPHQSFSQETGYYSGGAMPLTNKMQYFTLVSWPQDDWSPLITLNWTRAQQSGAAARMWVYAIDQFSELKVNAPDPNNQRVLDTFFPLSFLSTRDLFGWQSPKAMQHMCQYLKLIGVNRVTSIIYANQAAWGSPCTIRSWDTGENKELDTILAELDRVGGVEFIAGIVADGMYGNVVSGGTKVADMSPDKARKVIIKGFDEFIDRYGKYTSLKGIALGSMETIGFLDMLVDQGIAADVVAHIKKRRPDWDVLTYVGNYRLQTPYFDTSKNTAVGVAKPLSFDSPTTWDVVSGWEEADPQPQWSAMLGDLVLTNWTNWNHLPSDIKKIPDLQVYEQTQPDDHRLHDVYPTQDPRQGIYFDVVRSQELSDYADTPYAAIFSTFTEGYIGLHDELNFHYSKLWTGPDMNPAGPYQLFAFAQTLANRDRQAISAGTWNVKYFGMDLAMRRFAKAFRSLPPVDMTPVVTELDAVVVRWVVYKGKRYVSIVNRSPFEQSIKIDGKGIVVPTYQLTTLIDDGTMAPVVTGEPNEAYRTWINQRIAKWRKVLQDIRKLNPQAAPKQYDEVIDRTLALLAEGSVYAADVALPPGLLTELELRRDLLSPSEMHAPRIVSSPPMNGDLDAWPETASDLVADTSEYLPAHVFIPNSWTGPDDLSLRIRLAHDGEKLYIGIEVRDQLVTVDTKDSVGTDVNRPDELTIKFSTGDKYLDWRSQAIAMDAAWRIDAPASKPTIGGTIGPFTYNSKKITGGYIIEGSVLLEKLDTVPGGSVGFLAIAADVDNTMNLKRHSNWARKTTMMVPHKPNFPFWNDARNCGKLILGK